MHRSNIQQGYAVVDSRFGIYVSTFSGAFVSVKALTRVERVTWKLLTQICVDEVLLRVLVVSKYDLRGMCLSSIVDAQSTQFGHDLTGDEILPAIFEHSFSCSNIVDAIFNDSRPLFLIDGLIQRNIQLHVVYPEIDLELLQALFDRAEVPDIGIGQVVRLCEHRIAVVVHDDLVR